MVRKPAYWTQELHQLKLHHSVWCQLKSRLRQRLPVTHVVQQAEKLTIPIMGTTTIAEARDAISRLRRSISDIHKESRLVPDLGETLITFEIKNYFDECFSPPHQLFLFIYVLYSCTIYTNSEYLFV